MSGPSHLETAIDDWHSEKRSHVAAERERMRNAEAKQFAQRGYRGPDAPDDLKAKLALRARSKTHTNVVKRKRAHPSERQAFIDSFAVRTGKAYKAWLELPRPVRPDIGRQNPLMQPLPVHEVDEQVVRASIKSWISTQLPPDSFLSQMESAMIESIPPDISLYYAIRAFAKRTTGQLASHCQDLLAAMRLELMKAGIEPNPGPRHAKFQASHQPQKKLEVCRKAVEKDSEPTLEDLTTFLINVKKVKPHLAPMYAQTLLAMRCGSLALVKPPEDLRNLAEVCVALLPEASPPPASQDTCAEVAPRIPTPSRTHDVSDDFDDDLPTVAVNVPEAPACCAAASSSSSSSAPPINPWAPVSPISWGSDSDDEDFAPSAPSLEEAPDPETDALQRRLAALKVPTEIKDSERPEPIFKQWRPRRHVDPDNDGPRDPPTTPPHPLNFPGSLPHGGKTPALRKTTGPRPAPCRKFHRDGWAPDDAHLHRVTGWASKTSDFDCDEYAAYAGDHDMRLITLHNIRKDTAPLAIKCCVMDKYKVGNFAWNQVIPFVFWAVMLLLSLPAMIISCVVVSCINIARNVHLTRGIFTLRVREFMVPYWRFALFGHAFLKRHLPDDPVCLEKLLFIYPFLLNMIRFYRQSSRLFARLGMDHKLTMLDIVFFMKILPFILFALSYFPKIWGRRLMFIPIAYHAAFTLVFAAWDYYRGILRMGRVYLLMIGYLCIALRFFWPYRKSIANRHHWYSPHLLSTVLFECDCDATTFQLRGPTAIRRALASLQLPQTLALHVASGTKAMIEYVLQDLEGFHLRGVTVGHASA